MDHQGSEGLLGEIEAQAGGLEEFGQGAGAAGFAATEFPSAAHGVTS